MPTKWIKLSHDAFARFVTVRAIFRTAHMVCKNCGQNPHGRLFWYGTVSDASLSGRVDIHSGEFCCKKCHDTYHCQ